MFEDFVLRWRLHGMKPRRDHAENKVIRCFAVDNSYLTKPAPGLQHRRRVLFVIEEAVDKEDELMY
jgi:hypothetical protein